MGVSLGRWDGSVSGRVGWECLWESRMGVSLGGWDGSVSGRMGWE